MRRAFTLLEVMIAVVILAGSLFVLVNAQTTAVYMTLESQRQIVATMLARELIGDIMVRLEKDGFPETDMEEEGDFANFGSTEGLDLQLEVEDQYEDFRYAWTVREIQFEIGGEAFSMMSDLMGGASSESSSSNSPSGYGGGGIETPDLSEIPMLNMLPEMMTPYIREARVVVWWGNNPEGEDQVEIVSHVINPNVTIGLPF